MELEITKKIQELDIITPLDFLQSLKDNDPKNISS